MLKTEGYENSELFMSLTPKNGVKASKLYSYKPTNGNGDFVWTRNSTAYRMNQSGVLELMGNNVPRVDYTNTCPELLIEKSSTNLMTHSESTTGWTATAATNNGTILGLNGVKVITNPVLYGDNPFKQAPNFTAGNKYTASYIVDFDSIDVGSSSINLGILGFTPSISVVNINVNKTTKAITSSTSGTGLSFDNGDCQNIIGNIYRISLTVLCNTTQTGGMNIYCAVSNSSAGFMTLTALQVELGDYATSYIPTTNTTQTRPQDLCYNTANGYGDAQFSVVTRIRLNNVGTSTFEPLLTLSDGTSDIYLCIYTDGNNKLYFDWFNIAPQFVYDTASFANGIVNIGLSYNDSTGDYIIVINGTLEDSGNVGVSIAGAFTGTINRLDLGSLAGGGSPDGDRIIGVQYYNTALIQSDLENLTS